MRRAKSEQFDPRVTRLARLARALSHPARIAILETLASRSTCICGEIVQVLPLAQSTVSQHLLELKESGLIRGEVEGLKSCYCLNPVAVRDLEKQIVTLLRTLRKGVRTKKCC